MKQKGFIYAVYIEGQFIEHFATPQDAKNFLEDNKVMGDQKTVIRPIVYFTHKRSGKEASK